MKNTFETKFREVVSGLGGQVLPKTEAESADFLFPDDNVIVELKTLMADARRDHDNKLKNLSNQWMKRGLLLVYGQQLINLRELNPICQREWLDVLQPPVEEIVSKANSQIRSSKRTLNRESARSVLVIANDGNFLHTQPLDYMNLVGRVLQKRTREGLPRFPHVDGVVYFSYRIPSKSENLPFWVDGTVKKPPMLEPELCRFHSKLKIGWYEYHSRPTGRPVMELLVPNQRL